MMDALTGPDSLRIESSTVEVTHLNVIGTIPGVIPLLAAARNGPGVARLSSSGDGQTLHWRAPGSTTYGVGIRCLVDGDYLLQDGEDRGKWLRVTVDVSELASGARETVVELSDVFGNPIATDDLTAGEATAGDVETYTVDLENQGNSILSWLTIWIDSGVSSIEISDDSGGPWVTPKSETTGLVLPDLLPGVTDTLHVRRTIAAAAGSDGSVLTYLHTKYRG